MLRVRRDDGLPAAPGARSRSPGNDGGGREPPGVPECCGWPRPRADGRSYSTLTIAFVSLVNEGRARIAGEGPDVPLQPGAGCRDARWGVGGGLRAFGWVCIPFHPLCSYIPCLTVQVDPGSARVSVTKVSGRQGASWKKRLEVMALGARDEPSAGLGLDVSRTAWPSWAWRAAPPCTLCLPLTLFGNPVPVAHQRSLRAEYAGLLARGLASHRTNSGHLLVKAAPADARRRASHAAARAPFVCAGWQEAIAGEPL